MSIALSIVRRLASCAVLFSATALQAAPGTTYLEIILSIAPADRPAAGAVYTKFKAPFLQKIPGARSKELLIRDDDVQVLHGFASREQAEAYLKSDLFQKDVVQGLKPLLKAEPDIRIYQAH